MKHFILVFLGGGTGSLLRYLVSKYLNLFPGIPWGTFTVNIIGSFLIGIFFGWSIRQEVLSTPALMLLITGFCGGFTTFSAFALENQLLLKNGDYLNFTLYTFGTIVLSIAAVFGGLALSRVNIF